jgi:hypothetical protein
VARSIQRIEAREQQVGTQEVEEDKAD